MCLAPWDYLIVTAANPRQAEAYARQIDLRRRLGLLAGFREALVVCDPGGRRVGSGGSTLCCLVEVLRREAASADGNPGAPGHWQTVLERLRTLIVHAGGDSRRLPAYGPCGKLFVPLPGESDSALGLTLLERQLPVYRRLPAPGDGSGRTVIASGDVLLGFDPHAVDFSTPGVTGLGCAASPEQASRHGVYCAGADGAVRRFLQKPSPAGQAAAGAVGGDGRSVLDVGVIAFDADFAARLLRLCGARPEDEVPFPFGGPVSSAIHERGLDFYREISCALGEETTFADYAAAVHAGGSTWDESLLRPLFDGLRASPFRVNVLRRCEFLHFGTTRQIISSGQQLTRHGEGFSTPSPCLSINSRLDAEVRLATAGAWIEGCHVRERLSLGGENVVVGIDVDRPTDLPPGACLDVLPGRDRDGRPVRFLRLYHVDDRFDAAADRATFCGRPLLAWLEDIHADLATVWPPGLAASQRSAWTARLFPAADDPRQLQAWLWLLGDTQPNAAQIELWQSADRYSLGEMAELADLGEFHRRRWMLRAGEIRRKWRRLFGPQSGFSAADLACLLAKTREPETCIAEVAETAAVLAHEARDATAAEAFLAARVMHTLGSAAARLAETETPAPIETLPSLDRLAGRDLAGPSRGESRAAPARTVLDDWCESARDMAFRELQRRIMTSGHASPPPPASALRSDEIVWGRAPARLDLAGGWTDTPPFALERGGCVLNAAVDLNGQPPIQVYARVTPEPVVRLHSIDVGSDLVLNYWDDLLDYGAVTGEFALVKAALVLAGFSPQSSGGGQAGPGTLRDALVRFGGGLEVTTLAAIPKGSGLGTSSIVGAVLLAVIHRVLGRRLSSAELFHAVLRLEQALTTGGGWQDQIGGVVDGLKLITTRPGLVPDAVIRYVPADVLDPKRNGGCTLLYYTGITRLAKNILKQVVGRYLDRDRQTVATLQNIHALAPAMAEAIARRDLPQFGRLVHQAWELNKQLDPNSTNEEIEALLAQVRPYLFGAKLLGAGGGGFLLLVCRSPEDAAAVRTMLSAEPPNERARFFDFALSDRGLVVSVC